MDQSERRVLTEFLDQVAEMRLHKSGSSRAALKKPLLLLLVIAHLERGRIRENRIHFGDIRSELERLIGLFGGRATRSGPKAEQPFSHMRSEPFWHLTTRKHYPLGATALVSDLSSPESFATLKEDTFALLRGSRAAREEAADAILHRWWTTPVQEDIRRHLGLPSAEADASFREDVLLNYRNACAFCGYQVLLNDIVSGVEAAHIRPRKRGGPDRVDNGIALCPSHHWGFDRGALTVDPDLRIRVAEALTSGTAETVPMESLDAKPVRIRPRYYEPSLRQLRWHHENVFIRRLDR